MLSCTSFFDRKIVQNNLGELFVSWIRFILSGVYVCMTKVCPPGNFAPKKKFKYLENRNSKEFEAKICSYPWNSVAP